MQGGTKRITRGTRVRHAVLLLALLLIVALALVAPTEAATVTINASGSGSTDISNLNTAISTAGTDGIVILNPGTYYAHGISVGCSVTIQANTTYGGTAANTIIDAQSAGRIFLVTYGSSLTIDNLTLRNGKAPDGAAGGFGSNGSNGGSGGAILSDGPVTIASTRILNCRAGDGGRGGPGGLGSTGGEAANCQDPGESGEIGGTGGCGATGGNAGSGGALYSTGSVNITSTAISGCSAGTGGSGGTGGSVTFSRLVDNGGIGYVLDGTGSINAADNWWGTGSGPSSSDTAGTVTASRWLVLGATASPASITVSDTSAISANLTYHSDGATVSAVTGADTIPEGTMVHFTASGGTVSPENAGMKNGIATTIFTPSGTGTATVTATVDYQSVSIPVPVAYGGPAMSIVTDPADSTIVYAGLDGIGIYRSTNSGGTWTEAGKQPTDKKIRALAIDPTDHTRLFAGTYGSGVYKSTDSGDEWYVCTGLANPYVHSLITNSSGSIFAGTEDGLFVSSDHCDTWTALGVT